MPHDCTVCGFPGLDHAPRGAEGGGSYEICPSCGFQFGVDDDDRGIDVETWRRRWVAAGMPWRSLGCAAPADWDARAQLGRVTGRPSVEPAPPGSRRKTAARRRRS